MPTLPASGYAYTPFPTTAPSTSAPQGYQRISSTTADFGAAEGQALSQLGATVERAGASMADQVVKEQELFNLTAAQEAANKFNEGTNSLLYGNPDAPGDVGFMGKQGRAAMDAWPAVRDQLRKLKEEQRAVLQNSPQRLRFDNDVNDTINRKLQEAGRHYGNEMNQWNIATAQGTVKIAQQDAARAGASGDIEAWNAATERSATSMIAAMTRANQTPEQIQAAVTDLKRDSAVGLIQNIADRDPVKARDLIERSSDLLGDKKASLLDHVRSRADEREARRLANTLPGGGDFADRVIGIESGGRDDAKNPRSSATGAGQFIDSTWLSQVKKDAPEVATGKSDAEILALRSDRALSRRMIDSYAADNKDFLQSRGLPTDDGALYLAHFLGPQGAAQVLSASPLTPVSAIIGADAVTANPQLRGKTAGDLRQELQRRMGSGSLAEREAVIEKSGASPEVVDRAVRIAEQKTQMVRADEAHQRQLRTQADKDADDALETDYNRRMAARDATITAQSILEDPRWRDPTAARRQVAFFEAATKADPDKSTDNNNSIELFRRITLPDDSDPMKIRTREPLDQAYIAKAITRPTYDKLRTDLKEDVLGGSVADINRNVSASIVAARSTIRPYAAFGAIEAQADKDAGTREADYLRWVQDRVKAYVDTGKDWRTLFQPTINGNPNPDYVRSPDNLVTFKPPASAAPGTFSDTNAQKKVVAPVIDLTTRAGIVAAHRAGHITRDAAAAKLKEIGVTFSEPLSAPVR